MSFLRSVIADARPRKPLFEPSNSPSALSGARPHLADRDVFRGESAAFMGEEISPATHRLSRMDAHSRVDRPRSTLSGDEPAASGPTRPEAVNDSFSEFPTEAGMVHGPASGTIDDTDMTSALSANHSPARGRSRQDHETALSLNEMTWHNDDALSETASNPENGHPIAGHGEPDSDPTFVPDTTENSLAEGWERSESGIQPPVEVFTTRLSGAAFPQPETTVRFAVEEQKHGPASRIGGEPVDALSKDPGHTVNLPIATAGEDKQDGHVTGAELSGKVSAPDEFPRREDYPNTVENKPYAAPMPTARYGPEPAEKNAHQAGHPQPSSTDAAQVQPKAVTKGSLVQDKAVAGDIAVRKATEAVNNTVNDIMTHDMDSGPLSASSAREAGREKALTRVAAQAQPAQVQASVLPGNPIYYNHGSHTAKTAYGTSAAAPKAPEVKIGQVDVFIETPHRSHNPRASSPPASHSLASRHYLRRL